MGNSSVQLQELVDDAKSFAELAPSLATGGYSDMPALSIANDVMQAMVAGGPDGQPFNWKWNRMLDPTFFINSWQQDYFIPGLVSLGWLESCTAVNFSMTTFPKTVAPVEVKRDLLLTNSQNSKLAKICWMQNETMQTGVWGQTQAASSTGLINPGPNVVYTTPVGLISMPTNPITQIKDPNGNFWVVTTYGTCGAVQPTWPATPVYPTLQSPSTVATTQADGSVVWTAINPQGQGFRITPVPGQSGPIWQIQPVAQNRVKRLTTLQDFLSPVPDDFYSFFKQGFFAQCYRRSPEAKTRGKFEMEWALWNKALSNAVKQGNREMDDWGFVPSSGIMDTGYSYNAINPAAPYGPW